MKNLLLLITLLPLFAQSQIIVNDVDILQEEEAYYIKIVGAAKNLTGTKIVISVDYRQPRKFLQSQVIKDKDGNAVIFNSTVEALNFFVGNGYEYVNSMFYTVGTANVEHILLRRRKE